MERREWDFEGKETKWKEESETLKEKKQIKMERREWDFEGKETN